MQRNLRQLYVRRHFLISQFASLQAAVDMSADAIRATVETGVKNVQAILKMASASDHYKSIPVERLQEMATHGLIIHPTQPDFLTCDCHFKKGHHICWPNAEVLEAHFNARLKKDLS